MVTPAKGEYRRIPSSPAALPIINAWDPSADERAESPSATLASSFTRVPSAVAPGPGPTHPCRFLGYDFVRAGLRSGWLNRVHRIHDIGTDDPDYEFADLMGLTKLVTYLGSAETLGRSVR